MKQHIEYAANHACAAGAQAFKDGDVRFLCGAVCSCSRECGVFSCFV